MTESQQNSKLYLNYNEQAELAENELENVAENFFLQARDTMTYFWGFLINTKSLNYISIVILKKPAL